MGQRPWIVLAWIGLLAFAACRPDSSVGSGPRLIQEVTLPIGTLTPTRVLSSTPQALPGLPTSELISPLDVVTLEADFVLVTPTPIKPHPDRQSRHAHKRRHQAP
jgi:hypothetical protein